MRARILVSLKDEVMDPGGRALAERLRSIGYTEVKDAKLGKYIELDIETGDPFQHIGILSLEFHVDKLSRPLL